MENALENLSKQQLLTLVKEQSQLHSRQIASHKKELQSSKKELQSKEKELQKTHKELDRTGEHLRKFVSKSGVLEDKVAYLESQLEMFRRMQFGQKCERFEDKDQLILPFGVSEQELQKREEEFTDKINKERKKRKNANHKGRRPLPDHLPVEEVEIYPEGDLSDMKCIGKEVTEELDCEPARFFIRRYIRYKYASKSEDKVVIAELPERVIDKGIAGSGLITSILVEKYCDYMPLYRQLQRFIRQKIPIAPATINGWCAKWLDRIIPLFDELIADVKSQGYLQVDETVCLEAA